MNPLAPRHLSPAERRTEVCTILARGLIRLHARQSSELSDEIGESCLHFTGDQCRHATPTPKETA